MKRRPVTLTVSDHAVLRFLEREFGLDVDAVRRHLADTARPAAELGAVALQVSRVKLVFLDCGGGADGSRRVIMTTALQRRWQMTGEIPHAAEDKAATGGETWRP